VKEPVDSTDQIAADTKFSGVVRVDSADGIAFNKAYGLANRSYELSNTIETQFAIASGTKGLTALTIVALIERKSLHPETTARSLLGADLPMVDDDVTVEQLLCHRSGIGDYLDEDTDIDVTDYIMPIPVHELNSTESYLRVLGGHAAKFSAGQQFSYCNSGYVLLALLAERGTATPFHDLVVEHVCRPAGMTDTAFLRSDELPGTAAIGYLTAEGNRSNVFHLPVLGSGDGGIYSTAADMSSLWTALYAGQIVSLDWVAQMTTPRSDVPENSSRYGMGFWLHESTDAAILVGSDAGVSFRSVHDPRRGLTYTVLSNTSQGAWPLAKHLEGDLAR
jgi:CubicO group peptidase (beta-lactamase class C family)